MGTQEVRGKTLQPPHAGHREHRPVLATDHLLYFYDSYHHGIEKPGSSGLKTEAGGGGSVPFLTPDHLELRSPRNKEHRAGCLSDPVA